MAIPTYTSAIHHRIRCENGVRETQIPCYGHVDFHPCALGMEDTGVHYIQLGGEGMVTHAIKGDNMQG